MTTNTEIRVIVFAKAPRPGKAKTRLIPALGADGAARLATEMLQHTLASALDANVGPVELCADPAPDHPDWCGIVLPARIQRSAQVSGDLGARMAAAACQHLRRGPVLLIGTDCAEMGAPLLAEAARHLADGVDCVLYPCVDGGYALLGLRHFHSSLFSDIAWSTDTVALETLRRIEALNWRHHVGSLVHDIDLPADLHRWVGYKS